MLALVKGTFHRITRAYGSQEPLDITVSREDRRILRKLGQKIADIGSLSIQQTRKRMWTRLNRLEEVKPMVWLNDICWHEMNVADELVLGTSSPFCRQIESELRKTIYWWEHMPGDMIVDPVVYSPLVVRNSGIGIAVEEDTVKIDEANSVVAHRYHTQIETEEDLEKIKMPTVTHDTAHSEENFQAYEDIFSGILAVEKRGAPGFSFSLWDELVKYTGVQEALLNLALRPAFVHKIVDRLLNAYLHAAEQYESLGLLALNNNNVRIGSGAYGYTDELPQPDFDGKHVRTIDLWGSATAQIFSEVSPQMHEEFALNYEQRWLEMFGLTYYGCCEPLDSKMHLLRKVPNLRKISVSPWNDMERIAEEIGGDYVFSLKPSPAILARDNWDPDLVREELTDTLKIALKYNCNVEIIMKDISTVRYQPQRLWEWTRIADEATESLASA